MLMPVLVLMPLLVLVLVPVPVLVLLLLLVLVPELMLVLVPEVVLVPRCRRWCWCRGDGGGEWVGAVAGGGGAVVGGGSIRGRRPGIDGAAVAAQLEEPVVPTPGGLGGTWGDLGDFRGAFRGACGCPGEFVRILDFLGSGVPSLICVTLWSEM